MTTAGKEASRQVAEEVARNLAVALHTPEGSFIRTPLLYPSGATVIVRLHVAGERFLVTDLGDGYHEAEMMGTMSIYLRQAPLIAKRAGIEFDQYAFFVLDAERDQLVGAVMAVANCALEAVHLSALKLSERRFAEASERLYTRLVRVFSADRVQRDAQIIGASNRRWQVASLVHANSGVAIFEPVAPNHISVVSATAKFHDLARLENSPARVAVVRDKRGYGDYINLLSQAAQVVDEGVSDETFIRLAKAA
jgi:hypothetical protein